jgi:Nitrile hydratase, alpha chain
MSRFNTINPEGASGKTKQLLDAVKEPRAVLAEFGTVIPDDVEIRVSDSAAMVRYLVLPQRPQGTADFSEEQLASLVTRDAMIGVVTVNLADTKETAS